MKKGGYILGVFVIALVTSMILFMSSRGMQCSYPDCNKKRDHGSEYCSEHNPERKTKKNDEEDREGSSETLLTEIETESVLCEVTQCTNVRQEGSRYCSEHTCTFDGCMNRKKEGSAYCNIHTCIKTGCQKRVTTKDTYFCSDHICHKAGCNVGAMDGGKYCILHTCSKTGCFNMISNGSYCSIHSYLNPAKKKYSNNASRKSSSSGKKSSGEKKEDPYHARDYGDVEDFYYDYYDDFESFDDAETYYEDVRDE